MAALKLNLSDRAVLIPEGDYLVEVEEVTLRETQDGESEYLNIKVRVADGEHRLALRPLVLGDCRDGSSRAGPAAAARSEPPSAT